MTEGRKNDRIGGGSKMFRILVLITIIVSLSNMFFHLYLGNFHIALMAFCITFLVVVIGYLIESR